ncbi:MAG: flagellar FlbD family protein [Eubacteriales bacterium]|nr:flagellar FlbD family protein [Eubacteriales bacterium]
MISVTRLNNKQFIVNAELIETIEETPDTVITLTTGRKLVVKESSSQLIDMVISYKQKIITGVFNKDSN